MINISAELEVTEENIDQIQRRPFPVSVGDLVHRVECEKDSSSDTAMVVYFAGSVLRNTPYGDGITLTTNKGRKFKFRMSDSNFSNPEL